jgi:hypothetical protein
MWQLATSAARLAAEAERAVNISTNLIWEDYIALNQ